MEWLRGKCIGKGAFGTVHLAVDTATGAAFAVKSVDARTAPAAAMACLESEIRILKRLSSPHVVTYLGDDGAAGTTRNLHMELVPGGTAAEAATTYGGIGERGARAVLRGVTAALRYLHEDAGVVHGDVKGRNVLLGLGGGGGAKLADFGAARLVSDSDSAAATGPRGTPAWMAPEVARGGAATAASDVWSLGCTALELLTGRRPWSSEIGEVGELLLLVGFGGRRPAIPAALSDACRDFLDRCLRRDAGQRWTCDQLLRHPFLLLSADDEDEDEDSEAWPWPTPSPSPSPRAVLDWAQSDSDSEPMEDAEAESEHEVMVMARAKGRVAELAASNGPRAGSSWEEDWEEEVEWGNGATWAADTWVPLPSPEAPRNGNDSATVTSPSSAAVFAGGSDHDVLVLVAGSGSGIRCGHGRPGCHSHRCRYKCVLGVVGLRWPPLAVVPVLVPCTVVPFVHSIQSKFVSNQAANEVFMPFRTPSAVLLSSVHLPSAPAAG